jgi:hypothetical protein
MLGTGTAAAMLLLLPLLLSHLLSTCSSQK